MKILIYGAGAVGGYLGVRLAEAGHQVTLLARPQIAEGISQYGLTVVEEGQTTTAQLNTVTSSPQAFRDGEQYDLIIMATKSYDMAAALDHLVAFCPNPAAILTIQNGIGIEEMLIKQFGADSVIAGSVTVPISRDTINRISAERSDCGIALAPSQPKQSIKTWLNMFEEAGLTAVGVQSYQSMKWSKAFLNIVGNATSAILNRQPQTIYKSDVMFDLEMRMLLEMLAVMDAKKIKLVNLPGANTTRLAFGVRRTPRALLKPILTNVVATGRGDKMPSFHIDLAAGKGKSEVLFHNGAIARAGKEVGVATPVNAALTDILWKLSTEALDWREFDGRPKKLLQAVRQQEKLMQA